MSLKKFDFATLQEVHYGALNREIDSALRKAYLDCDDRPAVGTARKVTLTISMKPVAGDDGRLCNVDVDFDVKNAMPSKGVSVRMKPVLSDGDGGSLHFQPEVPENPNQEPLSFPRDPEDE